MSENTANIALSDYAEKQARERAQWARVLAPVPARKAQQNKIKWLRFFFN